MGRTRSGSPCTCGGPGCRFVGGTRGRRLSGGVQGVHAGTGAVPCIQALDNCPVAPCLPPLPAVGERGQLRCRGVPAVVAAIVIVRLLHWRVILRPGCACRVTECLGHQGACNRRQRGQRDAGQEASAMLGYLSYLTELLPKLSRQAGTRWPPLACWSQPWLVWRSC